MKRATIISLSGKPDFCENLYESFKNKIPKEFAKKYQYVKGSSQLQLPLEPDSPELEQVIIASQEPNPFLTSKVQYTRKEFEEAPFYQTITSYPFELEGTDATNYGTQYEGGCPHCGLGGNLVGNLMVDRKLFKTQKIGIASPYYFVSETMREIIESNNLTGITFGPELKDYKGRNMPKFYVLNVESILPPLSASAWLYTPEKYNRYPECGHEVVYLRSDLQYEKEKLSDAKDFNLTTEYLNNWRDRELVVSAKARKVFQEYKIRAHYIPVALL